MAAGGRRSPKDNWRQTRIAAERGRKRKERLERDYRPDRSWRAHKPKLNPSFKLRGKPRGTWHFPLPNVMDLSTPESTQAVLEFIENFRDQALLNHRKRIVLDHAKVVAMSPEVALLVLAEIQRCRQYCKTRTQITGTYPKEVSVSSLLSEMGFYDALEIKSPALPKGYQSRTYVRVERHNKTLAKVADELLDCFSQEFDFGEKDRKRLHIALIECMDNVFEHAYATDSQSPFLYREWWMSGYADHSDGSIGFAFYDQGAGIVSTIKSKKGSRVRRFLSQWDDSKWLERAVLRPISRHQSARRGHGLSKLKKFADEAMHGSLRVLSNQADVTFEASGGVNRRVSRRGLAGSLVVWKLSHPQVQSTPDTPVATTQ